MAKERFDHKAIEQAAAEKWAAQDLYRSTEDASKEKVYVLDMFPYPSGEGLHVGHPKGYIATDIYSRMQRMKGKAVLHPMGWDAFGLPAENYALKHKVHPRKAVEKNIENFKGQLSRIGFDYDWSREINTTDPTYYHFTQWIFLKFFEQGLAYQSDEPINWCPSCLTGLANEDLDGTTCERCGSEVEKKKLPQWVLKIREYADRLLADLDTLDWPEHIKEAQRNWIGRSKGATIDFALSFKKNVEANSWKDKDGKPAHISVFTTRPDTLFGATYVVLAPEHPWVRAVFDTPHDDVITNKEEVAVYVATANKKTERERLENKEKTGVCLEGVVAINPATKEEIPVYVADYVLSTYGTGAVMAVPAHDERDYAFAKKFDLPLRQVVVPCAVDTGNPPQDGFPEVKRNTVIVHVRDTTTGKYALLDWHGTLEGITTAIMGGIEEGQTPEEAALAEIREEAGLENARIVRMAPWITAAKYCASHKQQNRTAHAYGFLAEVDGLGDQKETDAYEQDTHTLVWVDEKDIAARLTPEHQKLVWRLLNDAEPLTSDGYLINSGEYDGRDNREVADDIIKQVGGEATVQYKIQDWVFSRQRYWGEPIPIIHCPKDGAVAVPYEDLPVLLPEVSHYEPTGTGESPLAAIESWVNVPCPKCGADSKRETNTMPQWAGSSWYYLRFMDPHNAEEAVAREKEQYWGPVDVYVGGDHAVRHLIYARFWHKFLYDIGLVSTSEPFKRLEFLGFILAEDGRKMSKRYGNVINPDDVVEEHGADAFRTYSMFMGPFENTIAWSTASISGTARFISRVYNARTLVSEEAPSLVALAHKTVQKVGEDIEAFKFNTAVSQMMIFLNAIEKEGSVGRTEWSMFVRALAPFAPYLTETLWEELGEEGSVHHASWPTVDAQYLQQDEVKIAVQVNGKRKGEVVLSVDASEEEARTAALLLPALSGVEVQKFIYVPAKVINIVSKKA